MNKKRIIWCISILLPLVVILPMKPRPLMWRTQAQIRTLLLKKTPLGTSKADVLKFTNDKTQHLFWSKESFTQVPNAITVTLGNYGRNILSLYMVSTYVFAEWHFDDKDILSDIIVIKETDGP